MQDVLGHARPSSNRKRCRVPMPMDPDDDCGWALCGNDHLIMFIGTHMPCRNVTRDYGYHSNRTAAAVVWKVIDVRFVLD